MPVQITMPRLSDTMQSGTIVRWNVKEGDSVASGDVVADVETDKATMEMPVYDDGVISKIMVAAGQQVPVGTPIAIIAVDGDDGQAVAVASSPAAAQTPAAPAAASNGQSAPHVQPAPHPTRAADSPSARVRVSPLARRMAEELGVSLDAIRGSGPGGRIVKQDILAAANRQPSAPALSHSAGTIRKIRSSSAFGIPRPSLLLVAK